MNSSTRVPPEDLRFICDPTQPELEHPTAPPVQETVGQRRARQALELGFEMTAPGYNVFVTGLTGSGRMYMVERILRRLKVRMAPRRDRAFVENFDDPSTPRLLSLPPGTAAKLKKAMAEAVETARREVPSLFENEPYVSEREAISDQLRKKERQLFTKLEEKLAADGLLIVPIGDEPFSLPEVYPQVGSEAVTFEVLKGNDEARAAFEEQELQRMEARGKKLPRGREARTAYIDERIKELEQRAQEYRDELGQLSKSGRSFGKKARKKVRELEERTVKKLLDELRADLKTEIELPEVHEYVDRAFQHMLEHTEELFGRQEEDSERVMMPGADPFAAYRVNVVQEASKDDTPPVVIERRPTFVNLFGTIESERTSGGVAPGDFASVRAGSILRADGGYIILYAKDVLLEPGVWRNLVRTLRFGQLEIQAPESAMAMASSALKPEPIDLHTKVILIGDEATYHLLEELEEEFPKVFKVKAEFDTSVPLGDETLSMFSSVVYDIQKKEKLLKPTAPAVARLVEEAVRLGGRRSRLSTRFGVVADVLREGDYWAKKAAAGRIDRSHVEEALSHRRERLTLVQEKMNEDVFDGLIRVETSGARVGQVNGLSYFDLGEHGFGQPSRLTASVSPGRQGIISIEREVDLSGPHHDKGVLILGGCLRHRYGRRRPLALTASIAFEQSYHSVDGDSASLAELIAVLSALTDLPVTQSLAFTGSIDQLGAVQAVGGVNEKIEGFFRLCSHRGLDGRQGCLLPSSNVQDLMLDPEVVEAVRSGRFHIHAVDRLEPAFELAFELSAEELDRRVHARLDELLETSVKESEPRLARLRPKGEEDEAPRVPEDPKPPSPGRNQS